MRTEELNCNYAVVFSENDIKRDFTACIAKTIAECDKAQVLVEYNCGNRIARIAEILCTRESGKSEWRIQIEKDVAINLGVETKMPGVILDMAMLLRDKDLGRNIEESLEIAMLISENFEIKRK